MAELEKCQIEGCTQKAQHEIRKTIPGETNPWLHVCQQHFEEILDENLERFHQTPHYSQLIAGG
jgi:hypothetical protein